MRTSTGTQTKAEKARIDRMLALGCICCMEQFGIQQPAECHHIVSGNKRLGHLYTLPLCPGHHRGYWPDFDALKVHGIIEPPVSIASGRKLFDEKYGSEEYLWALVQERLGLPVITPKTKIVARASA